MMRPTRARRAAAAFVLVCLASASLWADAALAGGKRSADTAHAEEMAPLIPMRDFFRNPEQVSYQLSPDGKHIAWLEPWQGRLNVHVRPTAGGEALRVTGATERDIFGYMWVNDRRIGWIQDQGGDENWHVFAADLDGGNFLDATPFEGVRAQFVDALEDDDEHVLISLNQRDPRIFDVHLLDVNTGELTLKAENPGNITQWITDHAGRVRVAIASDGVNQTLLYRATEADPFGEVVTTDFTETLQPLFFTFDNQRLYVLSNRDRDTDAAYEFDPATGERGRLVFEHDAVDVGSLMRSRKRQIVTGATFYTDKQNYHFFDADRGALQRDLEARLPGYEVAVTSMSRDETKVMVRTYTDRSRGAYYFLDRATGDFRQLVEVSPWIDESVMASMKPIKYQSRDGLTIHGYLTLPRGAEGRRLPAVVNVHGGPWARDTWGFNPEVQFLANRGYAVLQMNFRGSTGYGKEFWMASFKQWGRAMQDDVSDGVQWLIDEGIADPERIGIYGGSYGGYATLAGLTFTPDLYACGVDYVGVSNIFTWMEAIPPYWEPYRKMMEAMVGDPETDKELLEAASPLFHAENIKVPLLIAQGANDPRVPQHESDQIVAALEARGIVHEYIVKDNEGHGFANEENRFDFYGAMERFFAQHLGGSAEPETPPAKEGRS